MHPVLTTASLAQLEVIVLRSQQHLCSVQVERIGLVLVGLVQHHVLSVLVVCIVGWELPILLHALLALTAQALVPSLQQIAPHALQVGTALAHPLTPPTVLQVPTVGLLGKMTPLTVKHALLEATAWSSPLLL